jgi:hypothetical protein
MRIRRVGKVERLVRTSKPKGYRNTQNRRRKLFSLTKGCKWVEARSRIEMQTPEACESFTSYSKVPRIDQNRAATLSQSLEEYRSIEVMSRRKMQGAQESKRASRVRTSECQGRCNHRNSLRASFRLMKECKSIRVTCTCERPMRRPEFEPN